MKIKFIDLSRQYLSLKPQIIEAIDNVLCSGHYILGPKLSSIENQIASLCHTKFAVGLGNGSDAISFSLKAIGIQPGDEVITCPNSFIATAWAIAAVGATPVFVDALENFNIDPSKIEEKITSKTKAIIPIHLTGRIAEMETITTLAKKYNLKVIEDAAQAIGAKRNNQPAGSWGDVSCFSMHPLKNLHAYGDAGFAVTNNQQVYETLISLRNHGFNPKGEVDKWGFNSRLDELQAAILAIKLPYLEKWNNRCREIARQYSAGLSDTSLILPIDQPNEEAIYHRYIVQTQQRDALRDFLSDEGIETRINYPVPIHLQPIGITLGYKPGCFPVVERHAKTILSLPLYPELTDKEVNYVIKKIREFKF